MSPKHPEASRALPDRPNLRHLKDQAKDLLKAGAAASIADAQFKIARLYGFASWPKLKAHIESLEEIGRVTVRTRSVCAKAYTALLPPGSPPDAPDGAARGSLVRAHRSPSVQNSGAAS